MPLSVTSTIKLPKLDESINASFMRELAQLLIRRIHARTTAGKDADGESFLPLSIGYALRRQKEGYGSNSNLTLSGEMLNGMVVASATERTASIGFATGMHRGASGGTMVQRSRSTGAALKAFYNSTPAGRVLRKFFAVSTADAVELKKIVLARLKKSA